jgi:hypothetical protein
MKRLFIALIMVLSIATALAQNITNAEYFFDHDPGPGNGNQISVGTPAPVVSFTSAIPINLSPGFHWLGIRTKDSNGTWGLFDKRDFYIGQTATDMPIITAAEYFFDHDPGVGNGFPVSILSPGLAVSQIFSIPVPVTMSGGAHQLAIRVKDQQGHWALYMKDSIIVSGAATISCPGNVTVTAPSGQCTATVNNIDANVAPVGSAYTYTLSGATTGSGSGTASGHIFNSGVTTVTYALSSSPTTTCSFTVTVNANVVPSVTIDANNTTICTGGTIVFTAHPTNGGSTPHYQWKQNGNNIGTDSVIYQANPLNNGDVVSVVMTSSIGCTNPASATSNAITVTVNPPYITPTINITASTTTICPGTPVTFTATSTNGGVPHYAWYVNGNFVNGWYSIDTFQTSTLVPGDKVKCALTSSLACVTAVTTVSNEIAMTGVVPSVTINASATTICPGTLVTFNATPTNGGNPHYQWRVNGNSVGNDSPTWQSSNLQNGDSVVCYMGSTLSCATQPLVLSNTIFITTSQTVTPSVSIHASSTNFCYGTEVTFTAAPVNGGANPVYTWTVNNNTIGYDSSDIWVVTGLLNGDVVKASMVSSLGCAVHTPVNSNSIAVTVVSPVAAQVYILPNHNPICKGDTARFTALPTNGGDHPSYQWRLNWNNVGSDTSVFSYVPTQSGDYIQAFMSSSLGCVQNSIAESESIQMFVDTIRTYYRDRDGDWYGNPDSTMLACGVPEGSGWVITGGDCNDNNPAVHPESPEICGNGIDDNCDGSIDENCNSTTPVLQSRNYPVKEGDNGLTTLNATVSLDTIATLPVSVQWATSNGDATAGSDYIAANGTLTIPAGSSSGVIQLKIVGDLLKESNESFWINFSNPANVTLPADPKSKVMIIDDDKGKGNNQVNQIDFIPAEDELLKIPSSARRNQVWTIPQIGKYKNEISIMNTQGQTVKRFVNYQNNLQLNNISAGLYFYRIFMVDGKNQMKYYSGRLLITE